MMTLHQFFGLVAAFAGLVALVGIAGAWLVSRDRSAEREWEEVDGYDDRLGPVTGPITITTLAPVDLGPADEWDDETLARIKPDPWDTLGTPERPGCPECGCKDGYHFRGCSWNDEPLTEPPTDERLERVVLALTESPEAWRARVEQDNHEWRARMQALFDQPVDFGTPLELAA